MSTSKYADDNREASILVGDQRIAFVLQEVAVKARKTPEAKTKTQRLELVIQKNYRDDNDSPHWVDQNDSCLEDHLREIVIELLLRGERQYRRQCTWQHEHMIARKAELEEEERRRQLDAIDQANAERKRKEQARVDRLLEQANALQKAEIFRSYVTTIRGKGPELDVEPGEIESWATWALEQADRIDPTNGLVFLQVTMKA